MASESLKFEGRPPQLDLSEGVEMLQDFSREAQRHLISARNSLLVLDKVPTDNEAIDALFKTFHTIRGLASFLKLNDITALTQEIEDMLNLSRKRQLPFGDSILEMCSQGIGALQKLLELLDEQITNHGQLASPYYDVSGLISSLRNVSSQPRIKRSDKKLQKILPTIHFEPDLSACSQLEGIISAGQAAPVEAKLLKKLLSDFRDATAELKTTQGKVQERERQLIVEREMALKLTHQAQNEARTKSEYLANMSHEIRTLINAILGFTDLLKEGALTAKQKEHINTIILSGKMLLEIVNNILDFSKVEAGKLKLESIDLRLHDLLTDIFKIVRTRLLGKPVHLFLHIDDNVPLGLQGDPTRLKQIFINLLDNALKFTDRGEVGIDVSLIQGAAQGGEEKTVVRFVVTDSGIGIPQHKIEQIFESYTQAESSTTRLYGGTGLGLTLCKTFIEIMGGTIKVESVSGAGSRFIVEIPFLLSGEFIKQPPLPAFSGHRVYCLGSHGPTMRKLENLLKAMSVEVAATFETTKQCTEHLLGLKNTEQPLPKAIFIDTLLPNNDACMLAYKIKQQDFFCEIKLVAVTSDMKIEQDSNFKQAEFDTFLPEPVMPDELATVLRRIFGEEDPGSRQIPEDMIEQISLAGLRILVAEDSLPNQELLKVHFEALGCVCEYAGNGQEAVDMLSNGAVFDVCFMDLQMPVMSGLEASEKIRKELKLNIPIIALTAAEIDEEKERCLAAGMNDYLAKPFDAAQLKEKIIRSTKM